MKIRDEVTGDKAAVRNLHVTAFETRAEADLVDALRARAAPLISIVAEEGNDLTGHILFSPARLDGHPGLRIMGLAPMAVLPSHQGEGIGSALVHQGLKRCEEMGVDAVVVLGHPGYYPRFGFQPTSRFGIGSEYEVPERYHPAFQELG